VSNDSDPPDRDTDPEAEAPSRSRPLAYASGGDPLARRVADKAVELGERAMAKAQSAQAAIRDLQHRSDRLERDVSDVRQAIGAAPNEATGSKGSGVMGVVVEVLHEVQVSREEGARRQVAREHFEREHAARETAREADLAKLVRPWKFMAAALTAIVLLAAVIAKLMH
jgi:hypothetical protein